MFLRYHIYGYYVPHSALWLHSYLDHNHVYIESTGSRRMDQSTVYKSILTDLSLDCAKSSSTGYGTFNFFLPTYPTLQAFIARNTTAHRPPHQLHPPHSLH